MKLLVFLAVLIAVTAGLWKSNAVLHQHATAKSSVRQTDDPTTLKNRLKKLKARGDKEVTFPAPEGILEEVSGLNAAFAKYSVVVVEPLDSISILVDQRNIMTYFKFRVLETLSSTFNSNTFVSQDLSSVVPPLNSDEIYILGEGGSLEIDGVKVTQKGKYEFSKSQKYLLFVSQHSFGSVGTLRLGEYGVFLVKPDSSIEALAEANTPLKKDIARLYRNNLSLMKSARRP